MATVSAPLEDGGTVTVDDEKLVVDHAGEAANEAVYLSDVDEVSFTRAARSDYHGALVVKCKDGTHIIAKVPEENAGELVTAVREGAASAGDNHVGRFEDDGGPVEE